LALAAGLSTIVLDQHRFDADWDPDPNVHCDVDPYPDPGRYQNDADPLANPAPSFTYVGNKNLFSSYIHSAQSTLVNSSRQRRIRTGVTNTKPDLVK
jgi:hypothetical protein